MKKYVGWAVVGAHALGAVIFAVSACSNSSGSADAGGGEGGVEGGTPTCGNGPYALVSARVTSLTTGAPLPGATVTFDPSPCAALELVTDGDGGVSVKVAQNTAVNTRVRAAGYLTTRSGEVIFTTDYNGGGWLLPTVAAGALPHFNTGAPDIVAVLFDPDDAGADASCTRSGATFSVSGHPEAVVTYYQPPSDGGLPVPDTQLKATSSAGAAEISGLAGGQTVQLQVTAPGCSWAGFANPPFTGKFYLENGVLTEAAGFLRQ